MILGPEAILLATLAITFGAILQAATGLGAGMVAFPLIALISLELVPGPLIFSSFFLSIYMAYIGRKDIRFANMNVLVVGIIGGTILGGYCLTLIPLDRLGLFFGILLLGVVAISITGRKMAYTKTNMLSMGASAGFMGITVASGSPFVALLYQHEKGPSIRATLAYIYLFGCILTLSVLNVAGRFGYEEMIYGLYLTPGYIVGYLFSGKLTPYLDQGYSRMIILLISSISALALIVKHFI
ncbi:MAG: TSUP family transporter [Gammaproteobacteria bacterium]|nr:TSUP family transporter [Gammaproteobacteria bacterium]